MISFTRTAVAEMKNRIRQAVAVGEATAINIGTLDHTAFSFGIGCGREFEKLMGSFDDNIENAARELETKNQTLLEYLGRLTHVIIDEAQDITGPRIRFATLLLVSLRSHTGVTILADRAQAIYGFTNDLDDESSEGRNFVEAFDFTSANFECKALTKIHRTENATLLGLFHDTRRAVLDRATEPYRPGVVISEIQKRGESQGQDVQALPLQDGDLVLFRKRASALMASQFCPSVFRMRLPGYPPAILPWIGYVLHGWTKATMTKEEFTKAWNSMPPELSVGFVGERAWELLIHYAQDRRGNLSLRNLRTVAGRTRPPVELCYLDYGGLGPIFSTIHASKGREADRVFLMLPKDPAEQKRNSDLDPEEEARVYYVGATRVRKEFFHGIALSMFRAGRLEKNGQRVVESVSIDKKPKVQIGLAGDIDDAGLISRQVELCASGAEAVRNQKALVGFWIDAVKNEDLPEVTGRLKKVTIDDKEKYLYHFSSGLHSLAWSGDGLSIDLWALARKHQAKANFGKLRPPNELPQLRMIGLRTCVIPPDSALEGEVHLPFSESGFFLAPMIVGFPSVFFVFQKGRK
jgi:hypothetical protein